MLQILFLTFADINIIPDKKSAKVIESNSAGIDSPWNIYFVLQFSIKNHEQKISISLGWEHTFDVIQ